MERIPAANGQKRKPRILVVEDDRASRSAMIALLQLSGFDALPATTAAEAMEMLGSQPAVVILDLMLPDRNGAVILAHIGEQRLPIRVVVTTGAIEWEKMLRQSPTAPDLVLQKPVDFQELRPAVGLSQVRLATEDELRALFPDCELGAMPPFGSIYGLGVYLDSSLVAEPEIAFNAGTHREVIHMRTAEFRRVAKPDIVSLVREPAMHGAW